MKAVFKSLHAEPSEPSVTPLSPLSRPMEARSVSTGLAVVELFQSQGCNSCPPANSYLLSHIPSNDQQTLLLTYQVTYWDYLGWHDTFGDKRWDTRQRDYATVLRQRSVYTPQVLVDGGKQPLAGGWRDVKAAIAAHENEMVGLDVVVREGNRVIRVGKGNGQRGDVLAVWYEPKPQDVKIPSGENRGEKLPHRNVVRDMQVIGEWKGDEDDFELPAEREGLDMAVLVQAGRGGEIIGATRV